VITLEKKQKGQPVGAALFFELKLGT